MMNDAIKKVSWLELFYDLAFVALIAQLTYTVAEHHKTLLDLFLVGLAGYMIFIAWIGTTIDRNLNDTETRKDKLLVQLQVVFAFFMSVTLTGIFEGSLTPFFVSFALIRVVQLYIRYQWYENNPELAPKTRNMLWGNTIATGLWIVAGFFMLPYAYVVAGLALVLDVLAPQTKGKGNKLIMLNIGHLQERLGLFLILVIGESMLVVALANSVTSSLISDQAVVTLSGLFLMIALWWTYFGYLDACGAERVPNNLFLYLHAHGSLFGGVVLIAAAFKNFLAHETLQLSDQLLLTAGVFVVACTILAIRMTLEVKGTLRTGAVRVMAVGIPLAGYVGYKSGDIVSAVLLMTVWVMFAAFYDEYKRATALGNCA